MVSLKGDLTEWNEWRENNQKASILLEGANFISANLKGAKLIAAIVDKQLGGEGKAGHIEKNRISGLVHRAFSLKGNMEWSKR